jgi:chromosomal replication initiator protein
LSLNLHNASGSDRQANNSVLEIQNEGDRPMIPAHSSRGISIREVQQTVALAFNLSVRDMVSPSRRRNVTCARHVAMYLSREMAVRGWRAMSHTVASAPSAPPSFPRIGIAFARDHSSVIHACTTVKRRLRDDLGFALLLNRLAGDLHDHAIASATMPEAS